MSNESYPQPCHPFSWLNLFASEIIPGNAFYYYNLFEICSSLKSFTRIFSPTIITEERFCGIYLTPQYGALSGIWLLFINVRECVYMKQPSGFWVSTKVVPAATSPFAVHKHAGELLQQILQYHDAKSLFAVAAIDRFLFSRDSQKTA